MSQKVIQDLLVALGVVGLSVTLSSLDLFGMGEAAKRQSDHNYQAINDAVLPFTGEDNRKAADEILIVEYPVDDYDEITDESGNREQVLVRQTFATSGWPMPIDHFTAITEKARDGDAASLFFDVILGVSRAHEEAAFCAFAHTLAEASKIDIEFDDFLQQTLYRGINGNSSLPYNERCLSLALSLEEGLEPYIISVDSRQDFARARIDEVRDQDGLPVFIGASNAYLTLGHETSHLADEGGWSSGLLDCRDGQDSCTLRAKENTLFSRSRMESIAQQLMLDSVAILVSVDTYQPAKNGYLLFPQSAYLGAALAIAYSVPCSESESVHCTAKQILDKPDANSTESPLYLDWTGSATKALGKGDCLPRNFRVHKMLSVMMYGIASGTEASRLVQKTTCRGFETILLPTFLKTSDSSSRPNLHERHILFGTAVNVLGDAVTVPIRGYVPGVDVHATALRDLLVTSRQPSRLIDDVTQALLLLISAGAVLVITFWLRRLRTSSERGSSSSKQSNFAVQLYEPLPHITASKASVLFGTYCLALGLGVVTAPIVNSPSNDIGHHLLSVAPELLGGIFLLGLAFLFFRASLVSLSKAKATDDTIPTQNVRGRVPKLLLEAAIVIAGAICLLIPIIQVVFQVKSNPLLPLIYSFTIGSLVGVGFFLLLVWQELRDKITISAREQLPKTKAHQQDETKKFGKFLSHLANNIARRTQNSGIHVLLLSIALIIIFLISLLLSEMTTAPPANIFAIGFGVLTAYWITFRNRIEPDLRVGANPPSTRHETPRANTCQCVDFSRYDLRPVSKGQP